ncbi:hypothetical protein HBA54_04170 [Pelagibius litoralis]|uniref:Uncharacterized protein n=1 Tax=Pelagibius litoralis TaxID=374515 RepID=A0A967C245_9PROT|nr:hypothetical protein [Pelagibius litoralis]NIA67778.1 hypothetical protein [Pelagibius litoralis]
MGDNNEVESKLFDAEVLPDGWVDSPAKVKAKAAKKPVSKANGQRKPGRPRKAVSEGENAPQP